jgi:hypothetical protein
MPLHGDFVISRHPLPPLAGFPRWDRHCSEWHTTLGSALEGLDAHQQRCHPTTGTPVWDSVALVPACDTADGHQRQGPTQLALL